MALKRESRVLNVQMSLFSGNNAVTLFGTEFVLDFLLGCFELRIPLMRRR
jgi:hypothetical protein